MHNCISDVCLGNYQNLMLKRQPHLAFSSGPVRTEGIADFPSFVHGLLRRLYHSRIPEPPLQPISQLPGNVFLYAHWTTTITIAFVVRATIPKTPHRNHQPKLHRNHHRLPYHQHKTQFHMGWQDSFKPSVRALLREADVVRAALSPRGRGC